MGELGVAGIVGIAGIVIAALLSSFGYLYRVRLEGKRSARRLLYVLLELRHTIMASLFDPKTATEEYISHCSFKMNKTTTSPSNSQFPPELKELISQHFYNIIDATRTNIETRLLPQFEDALDEMSQINPVLAYTLKGREKIEGLISHTNDYQENFLDLYSKAGVGEKVIEGMMNASVCLKNDAFGEIADGLDKDVISLAKFCGWRDVRNCRRVLNDGFNNDNKYDFAELDDVLETCMAMMNEVGAVELEGR